MLPSFHAARSRELACPSRVPEVSQTPRPTGAARATVALIVCCTVVFVAAFIVALARAESLDGWALARYLVLFEDLDLLEAWGALTPANIWIDGQWWRLASAGFLHGSWLHLGLNMLAMWSVGRWTESIWGPWRQLALFMASSLGGCLASVAWAESPLVVGASAGIFGIAGGLLVARLWGSESVQRELEVISTRRLAGSLGFWILVGFGLPLVGVNILAQAGHVGGLVVGMLVAGLFTLELETLKQRLVAGTLGLGLVGGAAACTWMAAEPSGRDNYHLFLAFEYLDRGEPELAVPHFEELPEDDPVINNAAAYAMAEARVELDRALELVNLALEEDPDNADYLDTLGWIECGLGRIEDGRASLERAKAAASREIPEIDGHLAACVE